MNMKKQVIQDLNIYKLSVRKTFRHHILNLINKSYSYPRAIPFEKCKEFILKYFFYPSPSKLCMAHLPTLVGPCLVSLNGIALTQLQEKATTQDHCKR